MPEDKKARLIPAGWFDAWADATFATDPVGAQMNPPVIRAPNGVVQDGAEFSAPASPITILPRSRCRQYWSAPNGTRHAALHGADAVSAAGELAGKTLRRAGRGNPHHHHGAQRLKLFEAVQAFLDKAKRS